MVPYFESPISLQGLDETATPVWQMVPVNGDRYLFFYGPAGLTVTSTNTAIVAVTELARVPAAFQPRPGARLFQFHGVTKGNAFIQVKDAAGILITQVEVGTKNELTKNVTFYFLKDTASPAPHSTRLSPSHSRDWCIRSANIFHQCAIRIVSPPGTIITVDGNLGDVVTFSDGATDGWATLRALRDPSAHHTVFVVWKFERHVNAKSRRPQRDMLVFDKMSIFAEGEIMNTHFLVIARELGHAFGLPYLTGREGHHLMEPLAFNGTRMDKSEINLINP